MGKVFDFVFMIAVPAIYVGIPAVLFLLSEKIKWLRDLADRIGRDL